MKDEDEEQVEEVDKALLGRTLGLSCCFASNTGYGKLGIVIDLRGLVMGLANFIPSFEWQ